MLEAPLLLLAIVLFFGGLGGAFARRSLLVATACILLALCGPVLAFVHFAVARSDGAGLALALLVAVLGAVWSLAAVAVAVVVYRRRASVNLDELRELRG